MESSPILVAIRQVNEKLLDEVVTIARGMKKTNIYLIYVDEMPGLFVPQEVKPTDEAHPGIRRHLRGAGETQSFRNPHLADGRRRGNFHRRSGQDLNIKTVFVGSSKRTFFWRMVKGRLLKHLAASLPEATNMIIVG